MMLGLLLLLGVTAVYGQGHGHGHVHSCVHNNHQSLQEAEVVLMVVEDMDDNNDGLVSTKEVDDEFLTKYDHDNTGQISETEFVNQWHQTYHDVKDFASYLFHHFDLDNDLHLTKADLEGILKLADHNGDGNTTTAEFSAYLTNLYIECVPWKTHGR